MVSLLFRDIGHFNFAFASISQASERLEFLDIERARSGLCSRVAILWPLASLKCADEYTTSVKPLLLFADYQSIRVGRTVQGSEALTTWHCLLARHLLLPVLRAEAAGCAHSPTAGQSQKW